MSKQSLNVQFLPNFSLYWIYFLHSGFLSNLRLPWKTECALNSLYWIYIFYHSGFFSNFAFGFKNRVALKFFNVLKYFLSFRIFEQLCAWPEKQSCPELFQARGCCRPLGPPPPMPMPVNTAVDLQLWQTRCVVNGDSTGNKKVKTSVSRINVFAILPT